MSAEGSLDVASRGPLGAPAADFHRPCLRRRQAKPRRPGAPRDRTCSASALKRRPDAKPVASSSPPRPAPPPPPPPRHRRRSARTGFGGRDAGPRAGCGVGVLRAELPCARVRLVRPAEHREPGTRMTSSASLTKRLWVGVAWRRPTAERPRPTARPGGNPARSGRTEQRLLRQARPLSVALRAHMAKITTQCTAP